MTTKKEQELSAEILADGYPKLFEDVSGEIVRLIEQVKYEIQWLEQHCRDRLTAASVWDLHDLVKLKNRLGAIKEELRRESYSLSDSAGYLPFILGEVSYDDLRR